MGVRRGPIANRRTYEKILALIIGNSLTVLRSEWVGKTPLNHALGNHRSYRGRFSVRVREDNSGWVIVRLR